MAADLRRMGATLDGGPPGSGSRGLTPLPRVDQATMLPPPSEQQPYGALGNSGPSPVDPHNDRAAATESLLQARRTSSVGDVRRARSLVERAKSLALPPIRSTIREKPDHTISRYADLMAQRAARGNTESWRQEHARILMEEADALLRYRDYDEAERPATRPKGKASASINSSRGRNCFCNTSTIFAVANKWRDGPPTA